MKPVQKGNNLCTCTASAVHPGAVGLVACVFSHSAFHCKIFLSISKEKKDRICCPHDDKIWIFFSFI